MRVLVCLEESCNSFGGCTFTRGSRNRLPMICSSKFFEPIYFQPLRIFNAMVAMKALGILVMAGTARSDQGGTVFLW